MSNGFELDEKAAHFERVLMYAPGMLANDALNFFLDRFRNQNWISNSVEPWVKRKNPTKWGPVKNNNRSLLVLRARLKRSLRVIRSGNMEAVIGTDVPYARAHNEGMRLGLIQKVHAFDRRVNKTGIVSKKTLKTRSNIKFGKIAGGKTTVKAHTRRVNMNISKRQFMGDSPYLAKQLSNKLQAELMKGVR
ncbi:hypothetical protein SAMN05428988_1327 [Chitinophaga sp. YR573]|uniref:phage virion morphogenesis protein n=1 Tax=Chitinophaga sp. YR573 TaxID=1881040 RepID=UPI0008CA49CE|nr:phage virion morphogenesis protein [Chitinophaga sp. YR573]SEW02085.1 hypothetical protein SAMN05428988_1327 [Chitinophaga sp. YR573]